MNVVRTGGAVGAPVSQARSAGADRTARRPWRDLMGLERKQPPLRIPLLCRRAVALFGEPSRLTAVRARSMAPPSAGPMPAPAMSEVEAQASYEGFARFFDRASGRGDLSPLAQVSEALTRRILRPQTEPDHPRLVVALVWAAIDHLHRHPGGVRETARLLLGVFRGIVRTEADMAKMLDIAFKRAIAQHRDRSEAAQDKGLSADVDPFLDAVSALARTAGGAGMPSARLGALLALIELVMAKHAGPEPDCLFGRDDVALALRVLCEEMPVPASTARSVMSAMHRAAVFDYLCSPKLGFDDALRGAAVYEVGIALKLWESPVYRDEAQAVDVQRQLLAAITGTPGLGPGAVGAMAWGLGLHMLGCSPLAMMWHRPYQHIVTDCRAPLPLLVRALVGCAQAHLPAAQVQRLVEGLVVATEWLDAPSGRRAAGPRDQAETLSWTIVRTIEAARQPEPILPPWWA